MSDIKDILTQAELNFLGSYHLSSDDVFDARRLPKDVCRRMAKSRDKTIVIGSPCRAYGHRLRTRAGHCFQCDPKKLAFQERFSADQYVYIAGSRELKLIKIGTSKDIPTRANRIAYEQYGGASDWSVAFSIRVRDAGDVEHRAQQRLARNHPVVLGKYFKDGIEQTGVEMIRCGFSEARDALLAVADGHITGDTWKAPFTVMYEFDFSEERASSG